LSRNDFGLSEDQFVFCCFNNSHKIEPLIFTRWMNVLKAVPDSVLWLLGKDLDVQENLEREAEERGVDSSRLVFAERMPMVQHLVRYQLADLFLDTYWHNAHTTGAEALWQGLPLISIFGEVPSARGAASILTSLEMPELIVKDFDEYERLAIFYATHPDEYAAMREKLKAKRYTAPMYNTKLTVKHIESAYKLAWERYQAGLPPAPIDVPEILDPELRKSIH
jgi:protein O-GlcNAc transferase